MIRVALADDHQVVRDGVARLLEAEPDMWVVGQASSGRRLLRLLDAVRCDVVVLDLAMPGLHGRPLVERLRQAHPAVAIVIFSMYPEDPLARHFVRDGAHAYVSKERPPHDLVDAIRRAARGERAEPTPTTSPPPAAAPVATLSPAQQSSVIFLALQGHGPDRIAAELQLPLAAVRRFVYAAHHGELQSPLGELMGYAPAPPEPEGRHLRLGPVTVDLDSGAVEHPAGPRTLTGTERKLLAYLGARAGETVEARRLLTDVWQYSDAARSRTVTMTISRLRRKIELDASQPRRLLTILGEGYRLEVDRG